MILNNALKPTVVILGTLAIAGSGFVSTSPTFADQLTSNEGVGAERPDRGAYLKKRTSPGIPKKALRKGIAGCVKYRFTIDVEGRTRDIEILQSSNKMFDKYGRRAIEKYEYDPHVVDGVAVEDTNQHLTLTWQPEGASLPDDPACPPTNSHQAQ